jgi:hypothetical protein
LKKSIQGNQIMKKTLLLIMTAVLLISPFVAAVPALQPQTQTPSDPQPTSSFTHTVFIEEGTTSWCPNCPQAAEALFALYNNNTDYPFYYTALVANQQKTAGTRFSLHYHASAIPTLFFDGGNQTMVGTAGNLQQTETAYRNIINECGARTVHPLELNTSVVGHNNAKFDITVTVKNTGSALYVGFLRSWVNEIVSRWINEAGNPYHYAFLSYAVQKLVILKPQQSKTFTGTWDGAAKHGNWTFADIQDNNVMVITTVAHIQPHIVPAIQYVRQHIAFYMDQTAGATVTEG